MNLPRPVSSRRVILLGVAASLLLHVVLIGGLPLTLPIAIPDHLDVTLAPYVPPISTAPVTPPPRPARPRLPARVPIVSPPARPAAQQTVPLVLPEEHATTSDVQPGAVADTAALNAAATAETQALSAATGNNAATPFAGNTTEAMAALTAPEAERAKLIDLPDEGEVDYQVNLGTGDWQLARGTLHWKLAQNRYHIDLVARAVGIARLFKSNPVSQVSEGQITPAGLLPDRFSVTGRSGSDTQEDARFDWNAHTLTFLPSGKAQALPDNTQDLLSFFFQFAVRPPADTNLGNPVTNGRKLDRYAFELTDRTRLRLPLGEVETLHISRLHALNEDAFEIWLAQDQHFLPVQMRFYARGRTFTLSATTIRVSGGQGSL